MALRGMTILVAAGDGGNHFSFGAFPDDRIGRALNEISCKNTLPTFPAVSSYITALGGSDMETLQNGTRIPIGCSVDTGCIVTGGMGFSWEFPMPDYQKEVVQQYLQKFKPTFGGFNASGRAYPDLSTIANNVPIVQQGSVQIAGGTSCSAPEFAGMISLINDYRIGKDLPPVGFINQKIYEVASTNLSSLFVDITQGNSKCGIGLCCDNGFSALPGWDAFTGFGSPKFGALFDLLTSD